jgi:hypothetical protein
VNVARGLTVATLLVAGLVSTSQTTWKAAGSSSTAATAVGSRLATPVLRNWTERLEPAAAVSCRAGSCTGRDPKAGGCSRDARTVREISTINTRVELRYSARCLATWTRWTVIRSHSYSDMVFIRRYNPSGTRTQYGTFTGIDRGRQGWTKMIGRSSGARFQACNFIQQVCTRRWP